MTAGLELRGVAMRFGDAVALADIDLAVEPGRYAVLLGPSGCGKSTLLGILGGFLSPTAGSVLIGGRDVTAPPPARRPTTTVFQDYALFPHMTLAENVGFGLRMRGVAGRARRARAEEMLALVGLDGAADRRPNAISGGQRQRVALARALAVDPEMLLLDEPLGALDLKLRRSMQDELKSIQDRLGTTFVHVTHDQEEAMAVADALVVMRAGRIEDQGAPAEVYRRPRSQFCAAFMGEGRAGHAARARHRDPHPRPHRDRAPAEPPRMTARARPEDWYRLRRVGDDVTHIDEPHIREFYRCNVWHVRGRDRDLLVDSGMGVVSLTDWVPLVTERPLDAVASTPISTTSDRTTNSRTASSTEPKPPCSLRPPARTPSPTRTSPTPSSTACRPRPTHRPPTPSAPPPRPACSMTATRSTSATAPSR